MGRKSRESILKRQRERKRAEKSALKRQRRLDRKRGVSSEPEGAPIGPLAPGDEDATDDERSEPLAGSEEG
jgi:hypothetical protein